MVLEIVSDNYGNRCEVGEKVIFRLFCDSPVRYRVLFDREEEVCAGIARGTEVISIIAARPGFYNLIPERGQECGVCVSPNRIRVYTPEPPDFDAFWEKQKLRLAQIPPETRFFECGVPNAEVFKWWNSKWPVFGARPQKYPVRLLEFSAHSVGRPATGFAGIPRGAAAKSLPGILFIPGAGIRGADKFKAAFGAGALGMIAMDVSAHGLPPELPGDAYEFMLNGETSYAETFGKGLENPDGCYITAVYLRFLRALEVLKRIPEWDGENLIVHGSSQGGMIATACAALDGEVKIACIGVPALADPLREQPLRCFAGNGKELSPERKKDAERSFPYIAGANLARRINGKTCWAAAYRDAVCLPSGVMAAYNVCKGEKHMYHGVNDGHAFSPEVEWAGWLDFIERNIHRVPVRASTGEKGLSDKN